MHASLLGDIAVCIGAAWLLGVVAQGCRQPVLLAYLLAGVLIGPLGLKLVQDRDTIQTIAELGLIFLLFMIGLEIDLKRVLRAGKAVTVTAAVQILGGTLLGILFFRLAGYALGDGRYDALYLGVAAAMSSTVIIVKVLYDRRELDTLAGRITVGILVLQDLFAIVFLAVQPNLGQFHPGIVLLSLAHAVVLLGLTLAVSRFLLPPVFRKLARTPELLLVGALAWCFAIGELAETLQLSREMGALVAGVSLSTFPYAVDVASRVTTLRDFFVTLFFVGLGMAVPRPTAGMATGCAVFAGFLLASRMATVFVPLYRMQLGLRMSLLPALYLCQVSEFSLVILQLGRERGHISEAVSGPVPFAFVLLAAISTLGMAKADTSVPWFIRRLRALGLRDLDETEPAGAGGAEEKRPRILLLGFFRTASALVEEIRRNAPELLPQIAVVDFNPEVRSRLRAQGVPVVYGDISQPDTLAHAGVAEAEVLVSTVPDSLLKGITNARLVGKLRSMNPQARILAVSETLEEVERLRAAGADYVSVPRLAEAGELWTIVKQADAGSLATAWATAEQRLKSRQEVLP